VNYLILVVLSTLFLIPLASTNAFAVPVPPACPAGTSFNPTTDMCEGAATSSAPICPAGTSFNPSTDLCDSNFFPPTCSSGTYSTVSNDCISGIIFVSHSPASCPAGTILNVDLDLCISSSSSVPLCTIGTYSFASGDCVFLSSHFPASCPSGTFLSPSTGLCEEPPTCPFGTSFNPTTDMCEGAATSSAPICPAGTSFNPSTDLCESESSPPAQSQVIGGEIVPISTAVLLLAGAQTSAVWMTSLFFAAFGVVLVYIKKKRN